MAGAASGRGEAAGREGAPGSGGRSPSQGLTPQVVPFFANMSRQVVMTNKFALVRK